MADNIIPWIEKYRPQLLDDIISHDRIISTLKTFIDKKCLPHLLFYGNSGVGKTSTIIACAKELYGESYPFMVMELNASDHRGIETVRNEITRFVSSKSVFFDGTDRGKMFKLVILDETDAMTGDAQATLRKVIEKYTYSTRFCLVCNFIQKIIPALKSRCTKFRFAPLSDADIKKKVLDIKNAENIKLTKTGVDVLLKRSKGDMRKVLNILQSTSMAYNIINEKNINNCIGYPQKNQINSIIESLMKDSFIECYKVLDKIINCNSLALNDVIQEIYELLIDHLLNKNNPDLKKLNTVIIEKIFDQMRKIEYYQLNNEDIRMGALIGLFIINR